MFINASDRETRLWSTVQALRCPLTYAVISDSSGFSTTAHRRLQLAAEAGGSIGMLLKAPWELSQPTPSYSKWLLATAPVGSESDALLANPYWELGLVRLKGALRTPHTTTAEDDMLSAENVIAHWKVQWGKPRVQWHTSHSCEKEKDDGKGSLRLAASAVEPNSTAEDGHAADRTAAA